MEGLFPGGARSWSHGVGVGPVEGDYAVSRWRHLVALLAAFAIVFVAAVAICKLGDDF